MKAIILLIIFLSTIPFYCFANFSDVVINEIAWMGTRASANDEWIELYNKTDSDIDLDGWKLKAQDGSPEINLKGTIAANGFFILERTDNKTLPEINADLIYTGALNNKGEFLQLIDNKGNIIDEINCSNGWIKGNNESKQTMEKIENSWQTSKNSGGTPKNQNGPAILTEQTNQNPPGSNETKSSKSAISSSENLSDKNETNKGLNAPEISQKELTTSLNKTSFQKPISNNFLSTFLAALFLAIIFGISILFLQKKLKRDSFH